MMVPGGALLSFTMNKFVPMTDSEFRTAVVAGGTLMLGGYMAPLVKKLRAGRDGIDFETHERPEIESRDAALELTEEVHSEGGASVLVNETIDAARFFTADVAIQALLEAGTPIRFHLYLMDSEMRGLVPIFEVDDERLQAQAPWPPGSGVVGTAFSTKQFTLAVGSETSDGTFGLTAEQQEQHGALRAVAATPVFNAVGTVIAVLSGSDPESESRLATEEMQQLMSVVADGCARILIDLLEWFADDA